MIPTVEIDLGARRYPIHVGTGIIGERSPFASHVGALHVFVVTDETVVSLDLDGLRSALADASAGDPHAIPDGERLPSDPRPLPRTGGTCEPEAA